MEKEERAAEALEELQNAALDGDVLFPSMEEEDLVMSDGHTRLYFADNQMMGDGLFGFTMVDGGGFSGVICNRDGWERMKERVEELLAKRRPGN